jgi:hypothetical protein
MDGQVTDEGHPRVPVLEIQRKLEHTDYEKLLSRPSDIRYFPPGGREAAARWVRGGLW